MGWFGKLVAGIVVVVLAFFVVTRFTDGPMGIITGGAFSSGEVVSEEPDWRYVKDYDIVEFQLLDPARSRTTWIVEHDGRIFIPSGYMLSTVGKIWKQWPLQAKKMGAPFYESTLNCIHGNWYELKTTRYYLLYSQSLAANMPMAPRYPLAKSAADRYGFLNWSNARS